MKRECCQEMSEIINRTAILLGSVLMLTAVVGCGRSSYPDLAGVEGTVTLDGKPVADASVTFVPADGRSSSGRTDQDGRYTLSYKKNLPGAVIGEHLVKITKLVEEDSPAAKSYAEMMNARQKALDERSGFIPDEDSGYESGQLVIDRPRVNLVPDRYGGQESELHALVEATGNTIDFKLVSAEEAQP